jgi:transposase
MTSQQPLFDRSEFIRPETPADEGTPTGKPRLRCAVRDQVVMHSEALDDLIPAEHVARSIWAYVSQLDLAPLLTQIKAVEGHEGRSMTDPRILLTLWLYATVEGIGSARELARLCQSHATYKWIAGDVSLNYHTLADFRASHGAFLDTLLTRSVATLMHAEVVDLQRVAQDGMRVRANAGGNSFRRRPTLEHCLMEAREQVRQLKAELEADPAACRNRIHAARRRAAEERAARVTQALEELQKIAAKKPEKKREAACASTTDPESRFMKMADGGFRPAYNVQFATDTQTQVIVGVDITNVGSDKGEMRRMHEQIQRRYGRVPAEYLADGDFTVGADIEHLDAAGTTAYTPPRKSRDPNRPLDAPRAGDSEVLEAWRKRMATSEAQLIYRDRAASAECVNAHARNRGLRQFLVRGSIKVRAVALWHALAQNVMRTLRLYPIYLTN